MGLLTEKNILYRVYLIPAPNVDWYKFEIYADISSWSGKVQKLYSTVINRNGLKRRAEITQENVRRISEQTQLLHYLFRWGITDRELKTIQSIDFINSQIINNDICVDNCLELTRYDTSILNDEHRLIRLYLALKLWDAYHDDCQIGGVRNFTKSFLCAPTNREKELPTVVFDWAKTYLLNNNCYKEWNNKYSFISKDHYGSPLFFQKQ